MHLTRYLNANAEPHAPQRLASASSKSGTFVAVEAGMTREPAVTHDELVSRLVRFCGHTYASAERLLAQEARDEAAHDSERVVNGYNYSRQSWCECDYCAGERTTR